jgi:hypothetical protein
MPIGNEDGKYRKGSMPDLLGRKNQVWMSQARYAIVSWRSPVDAKSCPGPDAPDLCHRELPAAGGADYSFSCWIDTEY